MLFILLAYGTYFTLLTRYLVRSVRNFLHIELKPITIIRGIIGIIIIIGSNIIQINNLWASLNIIIEFISSFSFPKPATLLLLLLIKHLLHNRLNTATLVVLGVAVGVLVAGSAVEFLVTAVEEGAGGTGVGGGEVVGEGALVFCFVVSADKGLEELLTCETAVAVAFEEVIKLGLRVVHVKVVFTVLLFASISSSLFFFVIKAIIVIKVFNILLVCS